jgi:hypothetical protein
VVPPASPSLVEPASAGGARAPLRRRRTGRRRVDPPDRRLHLADPPRRRVDRSLGVSGEVLARRSTMPQAPGFVLVACGNRRESRCPPCSERYRRDAYFLVAAGLSGSEEKGVSTDVASHPLVFATFTAPSFGAVHRRVVVETRWRACAGQGTFRRSASTASRLAVSSVTPRATPGSAQALCPTATTTRPRLSGTRTLEPCGAGRSRTCPASSRPWRTQRSQRCGQVRIAYAKVAEFQARGVVHVHAVIRLDGPDGPDTAPAGGATAQRLAEAVARTAARVAVTVEGPDGRELIVRWGSQVDTRPITADRDAGDGHGAGVAGYLAKYATKDARSGGGLDRRIRVKGVIERAEISDHARALMRSAWTLSPRWAHSLGFRGHFLTKGRRYSVTFAALRGVRAEYRAQADPWLAQIRTMAIGDQVVIRRSFHYAGSGLSPAERAVAASLRASSTWGVSARSSTAIKSAEPRRHLLVQATPGPRSGPPGWPTSPVRPA